MANGLFVHIYDVLGAAGLDWVNHNIKVVLTRGYTPNLATHQSLADITGGLRVATSGNLSGKTLAAGVFDAADITLAAVAAGAACQGFALYKDSGTESTSWLIKWTDTGTGLPKTPDGGDILIVFPAGSDKIFRLGT